MSSVSSASSNLANLLQTLSSESPVLSSIFSEPSVQSALQKASPQDVVQLSEEAMQLQEANLLFGSSDGTQTADPLFGVPAPGSADAASDSILQALESSVTVADSSAGSSSTASTSAASSPADQASAASTAQAQDLESLFNTASTADPLINTLA